MKSEEYLGPCPQVARRLACLLPPPPPGLSSPIYPHLPVLSGFTSRPCMLIQRYLSFHITGRRTCIYSELPYVLDPPPPFFPFVCLSASSVTLSGEIYHITYTISKIIGLLNGAKLYKLDLIRVPGFPNSVTKPYNVYNGECADYNR